MIQPGRCACVNLRNSAKNNNNNNNDNKNNNRNKEGREETKRGGEGSYFVNH